MSSTSLYGSSSNVTVTNTNLTTLYNSQAGNVVTANVPDRNFTTLYTQQSDITPTRPYGNANVEAFLNVGHDGGNTVQNVKMSGVLTVGGASYLGPASNVHITGGNLSYVLSTDGAGNLEWIAQSAASENVPYIHFDVTSNGIGQTFTNSLLDNYATIYDMAVMKNGVNIEPTQYTLSGTTLTITILLNTGDTIDVLPSAGASAFRPGGSVGQVQYNNGTNFSGNVNFTYDQANTTLAVTGTVDTHFLDVSTSANLGTVANVHILGGTNGYVLQTDGTGNLSWTPQTGGGGGNGVPGGSNNQVQLNIDGSFAGDATLTYISGVLNATQFSGDGSLLTGINGANVSQVANATYADSTNQSYYADIANAVAGSNVAGDVSGANHANVADIAYSVDGANVVGDVSGADHANVAYSVDGSNVSGQVANALVAGTVYTNAQPNITSVGTLTSVASVGTVDFTLASNVSLGTVANLHIDGGSSTQVLSTDGAGTLSWVSQSSSIPGGSNTQIQYNNNGVLGGTSTLTFNNSTGVLDGTFGNISVSTGLTSTGNVIIQRAFEKFSTNVSAASGTVQYNVLDQSILYFSANAAANFTLNVRGNATASLNTILPVNDTVTIVFLNTVGSTAYVINQFQIDGNVVVPVYVNGLAPTTGTRLTSAKQSYTYTIMKTGTNAYNVLGALTEYR